MFSSISGNLSGMTGWIQESSKKAADSIQKSVTDISHGVTEMMAEPESGMLNIYLCIYTHLPFFA